MKKILFIMPLMVVSLLASCGNNNPRTTDEYTVTEQEMKDAFAMKDVEYLQIDCNQEDYGSFKREFTPTSNHNITKLPGSYLETLILKDGDIYYKYERSGKEEPFVPIEYEKGDFQTIVEFVDETFAPLKEKEYSDFYYNEERKEYMTYECSFGSIEVLLFQFLNKKLSKLIDNVPDFDDEVIHKVNYTFTYDKIEPPSPTI